MTSSTKPEVQCLTYTKLSSEEDQAPSKDNMQGEPGGLDRWLLKNASRQTHIQLCLWKESFFFVETDIESPERGSESCNTKTIASGFGQYTP